MGTSVDTPEREGFWWDLLFLALAAFAVLAIVGAPVLVLWCIEVLSGRDIPLSWRTYAASALLTVIVTDNTRGTRVRK